MTSTELSRSETSTGAQALELSAPSGRIASTTGSATGGRGSWRGLLVSQGVVAATQVGAGVVNLLLSLVMAHQLAPRQYAHLAAFLGVYLLVHTAASSLTPAVAMDPSLQTRLAPRSLQLGLLLAVVVAIAAPGAARLSGLPVSAVVLMAAALPGAGPLALARGRLYGEQHVLGVSATLASEPLVRTAVALALVGSLGLTGALVGVVVGGYLALLVAWSVTRRLPPRGQVAAADRPLGQRTAAFTAASFLVVAVIAAQDVVIAGRLLPDLDSGVFAAISTLGGAAFFATSTIPLMMLGNPAGRARQALGSAIVLTALGSLAAVAVAASLPDQAYAALLGEPYAAIRWAAVPYLLAMAALGLSRVLLAHLCSLGRGGQAAVLACLAAGVQLLLLLRATDVTGAVTATAAAATVLLIGSTGLLLRAGAAPAYGPSPGGHPAAGASGEVTGRRRVGVGRWLQAAWPLLLVTTVGAGLRLLVTRSIWVDEAISIQQAQQTFGQLIHQLIANDVHPPLFAVVLWAVVHLTGSTSELVVRMPALVVGTALVPISYAVARDLWGRRAGLVSAILFAVAPIAIWYSQEARMYAFWMLFATVSAWAQLRVLRDGRRRHWAIFTLASVASLWTQWFAALPLMVQHTVFLTEIVRRRRGRPSAAAPTSLLKPWLACVAVSLALFAPLMPYLQAQVGNVISASAAAGVPSQAGTSVSSTGQGSPDIYAVFANLIWALWGYHSDPVMVLLSALWPVLLLGSFAMLGRGRDRETTVLLLTAVLPVLFLFLAAFERRQFFELRYFTSLVPLLLLVMGRTAATWSRGQLGRVLLPAVLTVSLLSGLADQQVNTANPRVYDFRGALTFVADRGDSNDVMIYAPVFLKDEVAYYQTATSVLPVSGVVPRRAPGRRVFVLGSFLDDKATSAAVGTALAQLRATGLRLAQVHTFANVKVWEFS